MKEEIQIINEVVVTPDSYSSDVANGDSDIPVEKLKMLVYVLVNRMGMPKEKAIEFVKTHKDEILSWQK
jgi:hypothetical protein